MEKEKTEKTEKKKKPGVIRWSYLAPRLTIAFIIWAFSFFAFDPLLKWGLIKAGQAAVGAKVEIESLKTRFFSPGILVGKVSVADADNPFRNLFEFEEASFRMDGGPLLKKKILIRNASVEGFKWGRPRKVSGALPKRKKPPSKGTADKLLARSRSFSLGGLSRLKDTAVKSYVVKPEDLEAVKAVEEIRQRWSQNTKKWEERFSKARLAERTKAVKLEFEAVLKEGSILKKVKKLKYASKKLDLLRKDVKGLSSEMKASAAKARGDFKLVDEARKKDIGDISRMIKLPSIDARTLSEALVGPQLADKISKAIHWITWARKKMPAKRPKKPSAARKGLTVEFSTPKSHPAFLLEGLSVSGKHVMPEGGSVLAFEGTVSGLTSNPALYGKPAIVEIKGRTKGKSPIRVALEAILDHSKPNPDDQILFNYTGPMPEMTVGSPDSISIKVSPGVAALKGRIHISGSDIRGNIKFREDRIKAEVQSVKAEGSKTLSKILASALRKIHSIEATAEISGTLENPAWKVSSNLGKAVSKALQKAVGEEIESQKRILRAKVDSAIRERRRALESDISSRQKQLLAKLGLSENKINSLQGKILGSVKDQQKKALPKLPDLKKLFR